MRKPQAADILNDPATMIDIQRHAKPAPPADNNARSTKKNGTRQLIANISGTPGPTQTPATRSSAQC